MIRFFARQPVLVNMMMIGIIVAGVLLYRANRKEQMPEVKIRAVWVRTVYPGVSATSIEKLVSQPLEDEVSKVEGIKFFTSSSSEGRSFIWIELKKDVKDVNKALLDVQAKVAAAKLPPDIEPPTVGQGKVRQSALTIVIHGDAGELVIRQVGRRLLEKIKRDADVGDVYSTGIRERRVEVRVDPRQLQVRGVPLARVIAVLKARSRNVPGGTIQVGKNEVSLRTISELETLDDIRQLVVRPDPRGHHVRLSDLAKVELTLVKAISAARIGNRPAVVLSVNKEVGGDILGLTERIRALCAKFKRTLPEGVKLRLMGNADYEVKSALETLYNNGIIGVLLVLGTLWLFIGARNALIASLGIPMAILGAVIVMYLLDITINTISLFSLILCLGIVVDDSIVIVENVYRHLQQGKAPLAAAVDGTREVMWPVVSSVLTTVAAFLPLLMMQGLMGEFFAIIPMVVIAALLTSLFEAVIIMPSHMADFGRAKPKTRLQRTKSRLSRILDAYCTLLSGALRVPVLVAVLTFAIAGALIAAALLTKEVVLLANEDIQRFDVALQMPRTVTLERTMDVLAEIETQVEKLPKGEIAGLITEGGWRRGRTWPEIGPHVGMVRVFLVPTEKRKRRGTQIIDDLRARLTRITGPLTIEVRPLVFKPPAGWPVAVRVAGTRFERLARVAQQVKEQLRAIAGVTAIGDDLQLGRQELRIRLDPERASRYGVTHDHLAAAIRAAHAGLEVTRFRDDDEELDVVVRFFDAATRDISALGSLLIDAPFVSVPVPLGEIVRFESSRGLAEIHHRDRRRTVTITADIVEGEQTADGANRQLRQRLAALIAANPQLDFAFGGEWEETNRSVQSLLNAFAIAALLIFTILAAQFRSFIQPVVVLLAIPLSLIGVVIGFFVSGEPVGLIALVGVVGLAGIAVNDATVLVDFINVRRREGVEIRAAIVEACRLRMRPVMLTSITTIAGLFPLAMGWGGSSESLKPMALAIVWGMSGCTLLTLIVVPCLYLIVDRMSRWLIPDAFRKLFNQHSVVTDSGAQAKRDLNT